MSSSTCGKPLTEYNLNLEDKYISAYILFSGLNHEKSLHKMRVLTFMSLGEAKSEVSFEDLCKELDIGADQIEEFVIEGKFGSFSVELQVSRSCCL